MSIFIGFIKKLSFSAPVLFYPEANKNLYFVFTNDASNHTIGYYLGHLSTEIEEHLIA